MPVTEGLNLVLVNAVSGMVVFAMPCAPHSILSTETD